MKSPKWQYIDDRYSIIADGHEKKWGGYLLFDSIAKTVSLVVNPGIERPVIVGYRKNLKGMKRITDPNRVDRLIPYGSDGFNFGNMNGGILHVEDLTYIRAKLGLQPGDPVPEKFIKEDNYDRRT